MRVAAVGDDDGAVVAVVDVALAETDVVDGTENDMRSAIGWSTWKAIQALSEAVVAGA
jgi:hypothetical protein